MRKHLRLIILLAILAVLTILLVKIRISEAPTLAPRTATTTIKTPTKVTKAEENQVIFATTTDGQNLYINQKYGFSFIYPAGWRVENASNDFLQLFNYPEKKPWEAGEIFGEGENKIEMNIGPRGNDDGPDDIWDNMMESKNISQVQIADENITQTDRKWVNGNESKNLLIPLPNNLETFISITMHGDPANLFVLDQIISSFRWTKK